jgi:hypothetical protein
MVFHLALQPTIVKKFDTYSHQSSTYRMKHSNQNVANSLGYLTLKWSNSFMAAKLVYAVFLPVAHSDNKVAHSDLISCHKM